MPDSQKALVPSSTTQTALTGRLATFEENVAEAKARTFSELVKEAEAESVGNKRQLLGLLHQIEIRLDRRFEEPTATDLHSYAERLQRARDYHALRNHQGSTATAAGVAIVGSVGLGALVKMFVDHWAAWAGLGTVIALGVCLVLYLWMNESREWDFVISRMEGTIKLLRDAANKA